MLNREQLLDVAVNQYFGSLNNHDLDAVMKTIGKECVMWFPAASFNYDGQHALTIHFEDFYANFPTINFYDFINVVDEQTQSVVSYFTVRLVDLEGEEAVMRNCNIFHYDNEGAFKEIIIYNSKPLDKGFQVGNS